MKKEYKHLWVIRVLLWLVSLGITIYWIAYSFYLYESGVHDPHTYATILRPKLYACLIVTALLLFISSKVGAAIRRRAKNYFKDENN